MSTPYPDIRRWVLPEAAKAATLAGVQPAGRRGDESGAFWLGTRATVARVTAVVLPAGSGVDENPGQWRVSPEVFGAISRWAKPRGRTLLGIAHTHMHGVRSELSWADRRRSVCVPGILSVVIGNAGEDEDYRDWGWYLYDGGDYRPLVPPELARRVEIGAREVVEVWRADSQGVWRLTS